MEGIIELDNRTASRVRNPDAETDTGPTHGCESA